jgi:hypothetical protein
MLRRDTLKARPPRAALILSHQKWTELEAGPDPLRSAAIKTELSRQDGLRFSSFTAF